MPYLLTVLFVLIGAVPQAAAEGDDWIHHTARLQRTFQAPQNLIALRWGPLIDGQQVLLARSQTNPFFIPTSVPMMHVGLEGGSPFKFIEAAAKELIAEYTVGHHRLEPELATKIRVSIERALASRDLRAVWYQIHLPAGVPPRPVAAAMRAYDSTVFPGSPIPWERSPLEEWLNWDFPERTNSPATAHVELQFALRSPLPEIRDLGAFDHLLREVGSYLDLYYVSRSIPVSLRFITTPGRARVFQNPFTYGFKKDEQAPALASLVVLKMSGQEFVRRFGTRLPTWRRMYPDVELPPNALADPDPMRAVVKRKLAHAQRSYDCMKQVLASGSSVGMGFNEPPVFFLEEMPTLLHYLDGLFEALFDVADLPLLF
jgi:hypothetical protein